MSRTRLFNVASLLLVLTVKHALCQEPLPILELDPPDEADIIRSSKCVDGFVSDLDLFTVRGRVTKRSNSDAYLDHSLYLQAVKDPNTNAWVSQCLLNLTVCGVNLNTDCYCERKDQDGYYFLVMKIKLKAIYSGGMLRLSWNDNRSPQNSSITSNTVDYYPGSIREREYVTFKIIGANGTILDQNLNHGDTKTIPVTYTPEMRTATFCVFNVATNRSIQIEDGDTRVSTTRNLCVVLGLSETSASKTLTMTFKELEGCQRKGLYKLTLGPERTRPFSISSLGLYGLILGSLFTLSVGSVMVWLAVGEIKDCRRDGFSMMKESLKRYFKGVGMIALGVYVLFGFSLIFMLAISW